MRIHPHLDLVEEEEVFVIRCSKCGHLFCRGDENYKLHALMRVRDMGEAGRRSVPEGSQAMILYQEYYCPGCATLLEVDAYCPALDEHDPIVWDIRVDTASLEASSGS